MPEGENLQLADRWGDPVVNVVMDARKVNATYTLERDIAGSRPDAGLHGDECEGLLQLFCEGSRRCMAIRSSSRLFRGLFVPAAELLARIRLS